MVVLPSSARAVRGRRPRGEGYGWNGRNDLAARNTINVPLYHDQTLALAV